MLKNVPFVRFLLMFLKNAIEKIYFICSICTICKDLLRYSFEYIGKANACSASTFTLGKCLESISVNCHFPDNCRKCSLRKKSIVESEVSLTFLLIVEYLIILYNFNK